ncbi:MAG: hypothetical protein ACREFS_07400, partial [Acetobacteraceae bacterium]
APFGATGTGSANANGSSPTGSVSTTANANQSAFGGPSHANPSATSVGAMGTGGATASITP